MKDDEIEFSLIRDKWANEPMKGTGVGGRDQIAMTHQKCGHRQVFDCGVGVMDRMLRWMSNHELACRAMRN